jgi:hypothetical protein
VLAQVSQLDVVRPQPADGAGQQPASGVTGFLALVAGIPEQIPEPKELDYRPVLVGNGPASVQYSPASLAFTASVIGR